MTARQVQHLAGILSRYLQDRGVELSRDHILTAVLVMTVEIFSNSGKRVSANSILSLLLLAEQNGDADFEGAAALRARFERECSKPFTFVSQDEE